VVRDSLESQIDALYRLPLAEFTQARNALVKTVRGADATRVRTLGKPTVAAWAVNQVYWHSRSVFDRVMKAGGALRRAQIGALTGKTSNVREAGEAHRRALADAVKAAETLASAAGSHPATDALMRTFEALSLAQEPPAPPGRLTDGLQPPGFEALAGVKPTVRLKPEKNSEVRLKPDTTPVADTVRSVRLQPDQPDPKRLQADLKKKAAEEKKRAAKVRKAEAALERAKAKMRAAEEALKRTQDQS